MYVGGQQDSSGSAVPPPRVSAVTISPTLANGLKGRVTKTETDLSWPPVSEDNRDLCGPTAPTPVPHHHQNEFGGGRDISPAGVDDFQNRVTKVKTDLRRPSVLWKGGCPS